VSKDNKIREGIAESILFAFEKILSVFVKKEGLGVIEKTRFCQKKLYPNRLIPSKNSLNFFVWGLSKYPRKLSKNHPYIHKTPRFGGNSK